MSFCPKTRFAWAPDRWQGSDRYRFTTHKEAEASLERIKAERDDLLETQIFESPHAAVWAWITNGDYGCAVLIANLKKTTNKRLTRTATRNMK